MTRLIHCICLPSLILKDLDEHGMESGWHGSMKQPRTDLMSNKMQYLYNSGVLYNERMVKEGREDCRQDHIKTHFLRLVIAAECENLTFDLQQYKAIVLRAICLQQNL